MQTPIENSENFNFDDFATFTERVKKSTQSTVDRMEKKMKKEILNNMTVMKSAIENKMGNLERTMNMKMDELLINQ